MRKMWLVAMVGALVWTSCGEEASEETVGSEPTAVTVAASDYKFDGVDVETVGSGAVTLSIQNNGQEPHQAVLLKLNQDADVAELLAEAKKEDGIIASLGTFDGGPFAGPGGTGAVTLDLDPGRYALVCEIPDAEGVPHVALGMAAPFEITDTPGEEPEAPTADQSSTGNEFSFALPGSWDGTIAFTNQGTQPHEIVVVGAAEGKTIDDAFAAITAAPSTEQPAGPPPFTLPGGVSPIAAGKTAWFEVDLAPGSYYALCFVADPEKMAPHFALGMAQKFEVE